MFEKFHYDTLDELLVDAKKIGTELPVSENCQEILGSSLKIGDKTVGNRFVVQPVEGSDALPDGSPSESTVERYCRMVRGGFRILWIESVSVDEQGRSNPDQLWINQKSLENFKVMVEKIRAQTDDTVFLVIQLTHSGRNSRPHSDPEPVCAFSNPLIPKDNEYIISDDEIPPIEDDYVNACVLAEKAGFDAIDIRTCHGYLLNEFLAAYDRPGRYGGSFENRIRFLMEIIDKVKENASIQIGVRLNMYDGLPYPYGWGVDQTENGGENPEESYRLIQLLYDKGIRLFNITNGIGAYSPYVIRPYDSGGKAPTESQLEGIGRMLRQARQVKSIAGDAVVIASAFTWLREFAPFIAAGGIEEGWFDLAGFGRQALAYPDMVNDILHGDGMKREKCCITCCGCTNLVKKGGNKVRCIIRKKKEAQNV